MGSTLLVMPTSPSVTLPVPTWSPGEMVLTRWFHPPPQGAPSRSQRLLLFLWETGSWVSLSGPPSFLHGRECGHFEEEREGRLADAAHPWWDREKPGLCVGGAGGEWLEPPPQLDVPSSHHHTARWLVAAVAIEERRGWAGMAWAFPAVKYTEMLRGVCVCPVTQVFSLRPRGR